MTGLPLSQFSRLMAMIKQEDVVRIPLGNGVHALIDEADAELVAGYDWRFFKTGYAYAPVGRKYILLHRLVMNVDSSKQFVDHIDGDRLNNQRHNLRLCTHAENMRNRTSTTGTSRFKGVYATKAGTWRSAISLNGVRHRLGTFTSEVKAAMAYDKAARELHGEFARTNADLNYY